MHRRRECRRYSLTGPCCGRSSVYNSIETPEFFYGTTITEKAVIRELEYAARLGVEFFVIDAGWYVGTGATSGSDFEAGLGSFDADPDRFPSGLEGSLAHIIVLTASPGGPQSPTRR